MTSPITHLTTANYAMTLCCDKETLNLPIGDRLTFARVSVTCPKFQIPTVVKKDVYVGLIFAT